MVWLNNLILIIIMIINIILIIPFLIIKRERNQLYDHFMYSINYVAVKLGFIISVNGPIRIGKTSLQSGLGHISERIIIENILDLIEKTKMIFRKISFNGEFFADRMVMTDNALKVTDECTEVCQYYAFFTKTATKKLYPKLWKTLIKDFGPDRVEKKLHPGIYPANAFIGTYLRMELLSEQGLHKQLLSESVGFFKYMAERTGTLWENKTDNASLNHGFASHIAISLDKAVEALQKKE